MVNNFIQYNEWCVKMAFIRPIYSKILARTQEARKFIQVISGPRQVGKTTLIKHLLKHVDLPTHYASADLPTLEDLMWLEQQWEIGRMKAHENQRDRCAVLVLDEIQKIPHWSEKVKALWDEDTFEDMQLKVILLGSSPLLMQKGLTETLAGRFELIHMTHWSYSEMREAFDWDLNQYIYFGGYPGSADLIQDEKRWRDYINQSLIETSISRDILLMTRVDKPVLLRRLFELGCHYSSQILSYQKMLGQLSDVGNATTLAHYLTLLEGAGMLAGVEKFSGAVVAQRASSPKLQVLNTALISAQRKISFQQTLADPDYWGRLVESAVGAHFLNEGLREDVKIFYWRERNKEIDFVLQQGDNVVGIEVKSGITHKPVCAAVEFSERYRVRKIFLMGGKGLPLETCFTTPILTWLALEN